jgi:hypothetical protein
MLSHDVTPFFGKVFFSLPPNSSDMLFLGFVAKTATFHKRNSAN